MTLEAVLIALGLTLFAGLATGVGSLLAFLAKPTNTRFLAFMLGLSAGVMVYVSTIEIFPKALASLSDITTYKHAYILTTIAFFVGIAVIALLDRLVDHDHGNVHEMHDPEEMDDEEEKKRHRLLRMGVFTAIAIAIHNFPEGLATFLSAIEDPVLGIAIAGAIAIHNVPEGIAVSIPIYHATGNRVKAFWYSFASGLSEPIGALLGYFVLIQFFNEYMFGLVFAAVGGVMVFISLDQLLPTAEKYGEHHIAIYGLVSGMVIMASSLVLFL